MSENDWNDGEHDGTTSDAVAAPAPAPAHVELDPDGGYDRAAIVEDWGEDYPAGTALFCAVFDADDFDTHWNDVDYDDGTSVAIRRGDGMPPQGWIIANAHLSDLERTKAILEKHSSRQALAILYALKDKAFDDFTEAWGKDGGLAPGKSNRSARRSGNTKRR